MYVALGQTLQIAPLLRISTLMQRVDVSAAPPQLDVTSAAVYHEVTSDEIRLLPTTRSWQSFMSLAPSVNAGEIEGGFQVNGASGAENTFTIDGLPINSIVDGRSRQNAPWEFLQHITVTSTGSDAASGGSLGGAINAVTRRGGAHRQCRRQRGQ